MSQSASGLKVPHPCQVSIVLDAGFCQAPSRGISSHQKDRPDFHHSGHFELHDSVTEYVSAEGRPEEEPKSYER